MPGIAVFQMMFFPDAPSHCVGTFVSMLDPSPRGPRHAGQSSPLAAVEKTPAVTTIKTMKGVRIKRIGLGLLERRVAAG